MAITCTTSAVDVAMKWGSARPVAAGNVYTAAMQAKTIPPGIMTRSGVAAAAKSVPSTMSMTGSRKIANNP